MVDPINDPDAIAIQDLTQIAHRLTGVQKQRAQAVLLILNSVTLEDVVAQVGLTKRQVMYWLRRYQRYGLDIFPLADPDENSESTESKQSEYVRPILPIWKAPGISPDEPMSEAGRKILAYHFALMLSQEAAVQESSHPEAVHDMRVTTRRIRSALDIFGGYYRNKPFRYFRKELRRLARALGVARDLEVMRMHIESYAAAQNSSNAGDLETLLQSLHAEEQDSHAELTNLFASKHYRSFLIDFAQFVTTPEMYGKSLHHKHRNAAYPYLVRHIAPILIYQHFAEIRAYDPFLPNASLDTLHELRIAGKHLRYTVEAFIEVLDPPAKKVIQTIKALQNHLGQLQDARTAIDVLQDHLAESPSHHQPYLQAYVVMRDAEKKRLLEQVAEQWAMFNQPEIKRALALSIAAL